MKSPMKIGVAAALLCVAAVIVATALTNRPSAEVVEGRDYERLDADLQPFRSSFNASSDHVRAVLLVGPT